MPVQRMRLKIEMNTREHFSVLGFERRGFALKSSWFSGEAGIKSYQIEELLGTKLRALYQRRKGRDLFDLWKGMQSGADPVKAVECFQQYMTRERLSVSRAEFEANLTRKMQDSGFLEDVLPLLPTGAAFHPSDAEALVKSHLIDRFPGEV